MVGGGEGGGRERGELDVEGGGCERVGWLFGMRGG